MSLHTLARPTTFDEVFGQDDAVALLKAVVAMPVETRPKVFLLEGAYGCGKTTLAQVFAQAIGVTINSPDFQLLDASKDRGIDNIRAFTDKFGTYPMKSTAQGRVYVLDECHQLQTAAQEALLKKTEDVPAATYIFFATTDGDKLGNALRSRCKVIPIKPMAGKALCNNLRYVANKFQIGISDEDIIKIAKFCNNSCRTSIQMLETYSMNGGDVDKAIAMQQGGGVTLEADTYALVRAIVNGNARWEIAANFLKLYSGQAEPVRIAVLNYLNTCVINTADAVRRDYFLRLMECFIQPNFYSGKAALTYMIANAWAIK